MKKVILALVLLVALQGFAQEKLYYNIAVNNCKEKTSEDVINNCLKGSYLLNYDFKTITGELISTEKQKKPIVIIAASTRFAPCWGQLPALNKIVEKYNDKFTFIMIFKDDEKGIQRMAEKLDKRIKLIPPTKELENKAHTESYGFVHRLDYPTVYLLGKNKQFLNIKRGAEVPSKEMNWDAVTEKNTADLESFLAPALK